MCTAETHDELRRMPLEEWEQVTTFRGFQERLDAPPLELRNCRCCNSTLCRPEELEVE